MIFRLVYNLRSGLLFWLLFAPILLLAGDFPPRPSPPKIVNDLAGLIPDEKEALLENKLVAYNDSTSTQIAVVTLTSIGGYDPADYAIQLGQLWGVGQKDKDNGIVILIAKEERETFIATGYGVEDRVTDVLASQIVDKEMLPYFRQGDFYGGVNAGSDALFQALLGKYKAEPKKKPPLINVLIFIIIVAILIFSRIGGGGGRTLGRHGPVHWGGPRIGGGFGGGGSFGGGGFGGFGGGSFGGGGAGGRW